MSRASNTTSPIAALLARGGQNHFIQHSSTYSGNTFPGGEMGSQKVDHCVFVFDEKGIEDDPVVVSISGGVFSLQEYLSTSEARVLAGALLMAANYAEVMQRKGSEVPA